MVSEAQIKNNKYDKVIFYDLETTSLIPNNYIVTLSYIYYERGKSPIKGTVVCNPNYPIAPQASEVNGYYDEDVKDKPLFVEVWPQLEPMFRDSVWVGYNNQRFDDYGMTLEISRYGCLMPHHYSLDVMQIAKNMIKKEEVENYKLITLSKKFGIEGEAYHTSDFDTQCTRDVFYKLKELNKKLDGQYDHLFKPIEYEGDYTGEPPSCLSPEEIERLKEK